MLLKKVGIKLVSSRKRYTQKKNIYIYIHILYETLISFASYHMIHDYTSRYIKSDTEFPFIALFTYQFQIGKI